jgi:hypothetical protein
MYLGAFVLGERVNLALLYPGLRRQDFDPATGSRLINLVGQLVAAADWDLWHAAAAASDPLRALCSLYLIYPAARAPAAWSSSLLSVRRRK